MRHHLVLVQTMIAHQRHLAGIQLVQDVIINHEYPVLPCDVPLYLCPQLVTIPQWDF